MEDYIIIVNQVEELQTIKDVNALKKILDRARRTVIGGNEVILVRTDQNGHQHRFQTISNEQDMETYRQQVFRYLN